MPVRITASSAPLCELRRKSKLLAPESVAALTTSPSGRKEDGQGLPIKVCELFAQIPSSNYVERTAAYTPAQIRNTKKAIKKADTVSAIAIGGGMVKRSPPYSATKLFAIGLASSPSDAKAFA